MSRARNFASRSKQDRMRRAGYEAANPKALYHRPEHVAARSRAEKLEAYLRSEPRGERDLERLLDTPERRERDAWLRGVLDADKD